MGVYIKGMVMPYGCANCHFVSEPIYDAKGRATYRSKVKPTFIGDLHGDCYFDLSKAED